MAKSIHLKPKAIQDLEDIFIYSYRQFGEARAEQYIQDLNSAFTKAATSPELGRNCDEISPNLQALFVVSHVVFYKVKGNNLTVIRVLHKSMDHKRHMG
ncbi:type II toxin-antitoxin system RelE/ParE family toxin [Parashewanella curva]|uniref:Toxin n=1 Tax=Parashewanella curva TaxID=2338552 RepID=A0A3L8PWC9_9GAMM|nr:type II toxin-antitoxin system RelE/ParE family toxin [Parashewanella curva]RLV58372.1 type II toxin-antitoxin system RelE/ParE family toxin [Parashewanella curva]